MYKLKNLKKQKIPKPIFKLPDFKSVNIKVLLIGTRKLYPFLFSKINNPFVNLEMCPVYEDKKISLNSEIGTKISNKSEANHNFLKVYPQKLINF